jgi:superfamily II helicase
MTHAELNSRIIAALTETSSIDELELLIVDVEQEIVEGSIVAAELLRASMDMISPNSDQARAMTESANLKVDRLKNCLLCLKKRLTAIRSTVEAA